MKHNKRSFKELITKDECEDEALATLNGLYISDETFDSYVNQLYKKYKYNYESTALPKEQKQKIKDFDKRLRERERGDRIFKIKKDKNMHIIEKVYGTRLYMENGKKVKYSKVKWKGHDNFDWVRTNSIENI